MFYVANCFGDKVGERRSLKEAIAACPKGGQVYRNLSPYAKKVFHFG